MPLHDERNVRIDNCLIVWDGITRPEAMDGGGMKYTLKVVVPPNSPDIALLDQIGQNCLRQSPAFQGQLPAGAYWLINQAGPNEFGGNFTGWSVVNGITYQPPQVFDEQGQELQPMQYGQMLYPGQTVNILVSAKDYNNKSKGIKAQLEGFQIVASANSPRLNIGGGANAAAAFGAAPAASGQGPQGGYQQPPAQGGYQQPPAQGGYQQPPAQGGYQQPPAQGGYQPPPAQGGYQQQPAYGGAPDGGQPANPTYSGPAPGAGGQAPAAGTAGPGGAMNATTSPSNQPPQQQHNFLPPQG